MVRCSGRAERLGCWSGKCTKKYSAKDFTLMLVGLVLDRTDTAYIIHQILHVLRGKLILNFTIVEYHFAATRLSKKENVGALLLVRHI